MRASVDKGAEHWRLRRKSSCPNRHAKAMRIAGQTLRGSEFVAGVASLPLQRKGGDRMGSSTAEGYSSAKLGSDAGGISGTTSWIDWGRGASFNSGNSL